MHKKLLRVLLMGSNMLIPDVQKRLKSKEIVDCGDGMKPNIEKIIDLKTDGLLVSPFEK